MCKKFHQVTDAEIYFLFADQFLSFGTMSCLHEKHIEHACVSETGVAPTPFSAAIPASLNIGGGGAHQLLFKGVCSNCALNMYVRAVSKREREKECHS